MVVCCTSIIDNLVIIIVGDWDEAFPSSLCEGKKDAVSTGQKGVYESANDEPQKIHSRIGLGLRVLTTSHQVVWNLCEVACGCKTDLAP